MKHSKAIAGALCVGLVAITPAAAAETGFGARMVVKILFQTADTDGNGRLDPAEIAAMRARGFERADVNGDDMISAAELKAAMEKRKRRADMARMMGEEQIDRFDTDGDGNISRAEFEAAPRPGFALVDINADGAIDRAEMDRIATILAESR